jgi:hypothetical protein
MICTRGCVSRRCAVDNFYFVTKQFFDHREEPLGHELRHMATTLTHVRFVGRRGWDTYVRARSHISASGPNPHLAGGKTLIRRVHSGNLHLLLP